MGHQDPDLGVALGQAGHVACLALVLFAAADDGPGVDEHGHIHPRAGLPDGIKLGIVHLQPRAVGLVIMQAEVLEYLESLRAGPDISLELLREERAEFPMRR